MGKVPPVSAVRDYSFPERSPAHQQSDLLGLGRRVQGNVIASEILCRLLKHAAAVITRGEFYRLREKREAGLVRVSHAQQSEA